jgi:hypothetical protein
MKKILIGVLCFALALLFTIFLMDYSWPMFEKIWNVAKAGHVVLLALFFLLYGAQRCYMPGDTRAKRRERWRQVLLCLRALMYVFHVWPIIQALLSDVRIGLLYLAGFCLVALAVEWLLGRYALFCVVWEADGECIKCGKVPYDYGDEPCNGREIA